MADQAFQAFLAVVQRELGAEDAYLQIGGKLADDPLRFHHALDEATSVVAVFAQPPPDGTLVLARLATLSATFRKTIDSAVPGVVRPRQVPDDTRQRLDDALASLSARAGAVRALVFDLDSPIIWGASSLEAPDVEANELLERAAKLLRARGEELRQAQGHTLRLTQEEGVEALVRPFAGLYVLALLFQRPLSEPIALGAILHAVGLIEKLVLALPPIDPEPGAKVIHLRGPGGSGKR